MCLGVYYNNFSFIEACKGEIRYNIRLRTTHAFCMQIAYDPPLNHPEDGGCHGYANAISLRCSGGVSFFIRCLW